MLRRIATIVVVVALILTGVYFIANYDFNSDEGAVDGFELYYDDYIEAPEAATASGALEFVTIDDVKHIHAVDLGEGIVTFNDGTSITYTVKKALLDVYLLIGQSNAAYEWNYDTSTSTSTKPGTAYIYGSSDTPAKASTYTPEIIETYSMQSMNGIDGEQNIANIEAPLAASLYDLIGNKVMIVNGAIGGVSVSTYIPGATTFVKASMLFNDAMDSIDRDYYDPTVCSYIWIQGESDNGMSVANYKTRYLAMHDDLTGNDAESFFSEYKFDAGFISLVRATTSTIAQYELIADMDDIYLGTGIARTFSVDENTLSADNVHYTQLGYNIIGAELGVAIFDYYTGGE